MLVILDLAWRSANTRDLMPDWSSPWHSRNTRVPFSQTILLLLLVALPGFAQEAGKPQLRRNRPDIPEVDRSAVICFAYYTVNKGVLKMTAQLYPLREGESREATLAVKVGDAWLMISRTRVTEDEFGTRNRTGPGRLISASGSGTKRGRSPIASRHRGGFPRAKARFAPIHWANVSWWWPRSQGTRTRTAA